MNKKSILFFLISMMQSQLFGMHNQQPESATFSMCKQVERFIDLFNNLKSQSFEKIPTKFADLPEARNKMLKVSFFDLTQINQACKNNTAQPFLALWKDKRIVTKQTLALATTINQILAKNSN